MDKVKKPLPKKSKLETEAKNLGFRDPADYITDSCMTYMARTMELREFIGLFFSVVKTSELMASKLSPKARKELQQAEGSPKSLVYNFSVHRPIVNGIMLSRTVESFELYVLSVLREIFNFKPEMLKSEDKIEVSALLEMHSREDLISYLAERRLHELSFKPLTELVKFVESRTGIELFRTEEIFQVVLLASEVRNLISHNDCRVNDVFRRKVGAIKQPYEVSDTGRFKVTDEWLRRTSYTLDGVAFDFDSAVSEKFKVSSSFRLGKFLLRS